MLPPGTDESRPKLTLEHGTTAAHDAHHELVVRQTGAWPALPSVPSGAIGRPEILSADPDPVELLKCLRRRWLLATVIGLVVSALFVVAAFFFLPMQYEVEALLRVARVEGAAFQSGPVYRDPQAFDTYRRTQLTLMRSTSVLASALRDEAINQLPVVREQPDAVSWLEKELLLDYPGDSEVLRVRLKGTRPEQLAKVVNAVVNAYLKEIVQEERKNLLRDYDLLKEKLVKVKERFRDTSRRYLQIAEQMGSSDLESARVKQRMMFTQLSDAQTALRQLHSRLMESRIALLDLQAELERVKNDPGGLDYLIEAELLKDPVYAEKHRQLAVVETTLTQRAEVLRDPENSPTYRQLKSYRDQLREEMDEIKKEKMPVLRQLVLGDSVAGVEAKIRAKQKEQQLIQENIEQTVQGIATLRSEIGQLGHTSADLEARAADLEQLRRKSADLSQRLDKLELELQKDARVRLIQEAAPPESGEVLKRYFLIAFAGMCGLGIALFGVSYWEFRARRINSSEQLTEGLGIPVVGTLPSLDTRAGLGGLVQRVPKDVLEGLLTESIDSIRTTLLHNPNGRSLKVVMVTSPGDQEGKTTVATQLAISLARGGRRTLLVDADLRSPSAHALFELSLEDGLCEVLRGTAELDYAIRPTRAVGLWLLSAGRWDQEALHELNKDTARDIFDKLRAQFDFVVIDSAPVLSVADTLMVGRHADAAVLSILQGTSRVPQVYEATQRLESVGIPVLGAVVGGVTAKASLRRIYEPELPASA